MNGANLPKVDANGSLPTTVTNRHQLIDERSLAFDRLIAAKLRDEPELLDKARGNLARWLHTCSEGVRPDLIEWQRALSGPFDELLTLLEATDERARRLRQSSPFCGILNQEERLEILREFQARESSKLEHIVKDTNYLAALFRHRLASPDTVRERLGQTILPSDQVREIVNSRLNRLTSSGDTACS